MRTVNRVLIRGVNWVGDTVLTYPTVQNLKILFPQAHVAILVPEHLTDLWRTFPFVDEVIPFEKKKGPRAVGRDLKLAHALRKRGFDLSVIFPRSFRSALLPYLAQIPVRVGYQAEGRSPLLTHRMARNRDVLRLHRVHYYQKLIEPLGKVEANLSPRVYLRDEDRREAEDWLKGRGILDGRPLIAMNPGATYGMAKCWQADRFGDLGERLSRKWKASILLFGQEEERSVGKKVLDQAKDGAVDLIGKTGLLQLAALLERCDVLVTNDTGTMHIAAAVGTSVVAIFGSTDPLTTGPWGNGHVVVKKDVPCSPCLKRVCPTDQQCMNLISVDEVEEMVSKKLRR